MKNTDHFGEEASYACEPRVFRTGGEGTEHVTRHPSYVEAKPCVMRYIGTVDSLPNPSSPFRWLLTPTLVHAHPPTDRVDTGQHKNPTFKGNIMAVIGRPEWKSHRIRDLRY